MIESLGRVERFKVGLRNEFQHAGVGGGADPRESERSQARWRGAEEQASGHRLGSLLGHGMSSPPFTSTTCPVT